MSGDHSGILIVRDDGVINVPGAVAVPAGLADAVEHLLDKLGAPKRDERKRKGRD